MKDNAIYVTDKERPGKVKNLFDAISEIEYLAGSEDEGEPISDKFFTTSKWMNFIEVGVKASLVSGLFTAILTPITMGVFEKIIPVFGSYNPSIVDKIYVFLLAVSFSIGYAVFISKVGKFYRKKYSITKKMIRSLLGGLTVGTLLKIGLVFLLFHYIYVKLTPEVINNIVNFLAKFRWILHATPDEMTKFLTEFRKIFIPSAYFVAFTGFLFIAISWSKVIKSKLIDWILKDEIDDD